MKRIIQITFTLLIISIFSPNFSQAQSKEVDGEFVHMVYFWLKNPDSKEDRTKFEASIKKFINASEYPIEKYIGVPAMTDRTVVDNSYTYSLFLTFPSKAIQDKYQEEPVHKTFIKECEDLWERVQVYDSISIL